MKKYSEQEQLDFLKQPNILVIDDSYVVDKINKVQIIKLKINDQELYYAKGNEIFQELFEGDKDYRPMNRNVIGGIKFPYVIRLRFSKSKKLSDNRSTFYVLLHEQVMAKLISNGSDTIRSQAAEKELVNVFTNLFKDYIAANKATITANNHNNDSAQEDIAKEINNLLEIHNLDHKESANEMVIVTNKDYLLSLLNEKYNYLSETFINDLVDILINNINVKMPDPIEVIKKEPDDYKELVEFKSKVKELLNIKEDNNSVKANPVKENIVENNIVKDDIEKRITVEANDNIIHNFVFKMNDACIAILNETYKKYNLQQYGYPNVPKSYLVQRIKQISCGLEYRRFYGRFIKLQEVQSANKAQQGGYSVYLGDELYAKFYISRDMYTNEDASYDFLSQTSIVKYIPLFAPSDSFKEPFSNNGVKMPYGLMELERYEYALKQNLHMLFPKLTKEEFNANYDKCVLKAIEYCKRKIYE